MAKKKKEMMTFVCKPCGREVNISSGSMFPSVLWCCDEKMVPKKKAGSKKRGKR